jgi:hypothetical protein
LEVLGPGDLPGGTVEVEPIAHLRGAPKGDRRDAGLVAVIEDDGNRELSQAAL